MHLPLHPGSRFSVVERDRATAKEIGMNIKLPVVSDIPDHPEMKVLTVARMSPEGVSCLYQAHLDFPTDGDGKLDTFPSSENAAHYLVMMETWNQRYPDEAKVTPEYDMEERALLDGEEFGIIACEEDLLPLDINADLFDLGFRFITTIPDVDMMLVCTKVRIGNEEAAHLWRIHQRFVSENPGVVSPGILPHQYIFRQGDGEISDQDDPITMADPYGSQ